MKPWAAPVRWRVTAALSAFAGGKFKAGMEVGQDEDRSLDMPGPRQHPSVPRCGTPPLNLLAKWSSPLRKVGLKKIKIKNKERKNGFFFPSVRNFSAFLALFL